MISTTIFRRGRGGGAGILISLKLEQIAEEERVRELARLKARKEFAEQEAIKKEKSK